MRLVVRSIVLPLNFPGSQPVSIPMETAHDTIVDSDSSPKGSGQPQDLSSAWLKLRQELAEQAGWIGYDNYRTWILNNQPTFKAR